MRELIDGILRIHAFVFIVVVLTYLMVLVYIIDKIARAVLPLRLLRCASVPADKLPHFQTVLQPNLGIWRDLFFYLCRSPTQSLCRMVKVARTCNDCGYGGRYSCLPGIALYSRR